MNSIKNDMNISIIRKVIELESPGSEIILFGSRAYGNPDFSSDYDILVKIDSNISVNEKRSLSSRIRKSLAEKLIDSDVLIRDEADLSESLGRPGSVIKEALTKGIRL